MKPVILERAAAEVQPRAPEEALLALREGADSVYAILQDIASEDLQTSEPISCHEARLRLGLVEQLLCATLATAGNVEGDEAEAVRFAIRLVQGMAQALPKAGEMPSAVLYFMLTPVEAIVYRQFFRSREVTEADESELAS